MLAMHADYIDGFPKFLEAVSAGATTDAALQAVYHKDLQQVGREAEEYVRSRHDEARLVNLDVRPSDLRTQPITEAQRAAEFALADVLAANPQTLSEAKRRLETLTARYPGDSSSEELLGFLAMSGGNQRDAEQHFAHAVQTNTQDPEVLFRLAHLKIAGEGPTEEVVDLLQRVLAADSNHYNARLELGFAAARMGKFDVAVQALEKISKPKAEHTYVVSYTLAYCLVELHQGNKARMYAEQARKVADGGKNEEQVAGLLRYIDQELPVEVASH
jgi:tetratricopeptide (TPR) repeat protein